MADQPKKKPFSQKNTNDERRNKKAFKTPGANRCRKSPQSALNRVLLGQGLYQTTGLSEPHKIAPWRGTENVVHPYDRAQAEENKHLYPHLFSRG